MKNSVIYYSIGPLLYCPANNTTIADSITDQTFGDHFSLALCLEDTIADAFVRDAEYKLIHSLQQIYEKSREQPFYLPKIFIRIRNPRQMSHLTEMLGSSMSILTGFILPKFSLENADEYIAAAIKVNECSKDPIYIMPIYEDVSITDLRYRYHILYTLKEKLSKIEPLVLNIRVGGNDLCHLYGFRRRDSESIHRIRPIADIFSDIITVYGTSYVISGPVWEYYNSPGWRQGLIHELTDDRLCGFIGKTVIHPKQIEIVNDCCRIPKADLADAKAILNWDAASPSLVSGNTTRERMNEHKTHANWALQTLLMAEAFGTVS